MALRAKAAAAIFDQYGAYDRIGCPDAGHRKLFSAYRAFSNGEDLLRVYTGWGLATRKEERAAGLSSVGQCH